MMALVWSTLSARECYGYIVTGSNSVDSHEGSGSISLWIQICLTESNMQLREVLHPMGVRLAFQQFPLQVL
jgi:hypothetical protein